MGNVRLSKKQWEYVVQERVEAMDKGRRLGAITELKWVEDTFCEVFKKRHINTGIDSDNKPYFLDSQDFYLSELRRRLSELEGKGSVK